MADKPDEDPMDDDPFAVIDEWKGEIDQRACAEAPSGTAVERPGPSGALHRPGRANHPIASQRLMQPGSSKAPRSG